MHFLPILSTLRRHRTAALLIILEIALTCAIVSNAVFVIAQRLHRMDRPSGVADDEIVRVRMDGIGKADDANALTQQDLAALRAIPGVKAVAATNQVPFGGSSWNSGIGLAADGSNTFSAAMWLGSNDLVETLGVTLVQGRDFTADEYVDFEAVGGSTAIPAIILTRALAERLYPAGTALGKPVYVWGGAPLTIVGVIDHLARPNEGAGPQVSEYSMILPVTVSYETGGMYLLRTEPARKAAVLAATEAVLNRVSPNRIIRDKMTFAEVRADRFKADRAMAWLLVVLSALLLVITALGVVGLASFWVQQRTRQIGIRRALGATRRDIVHYFQLENFILTTIGIGLGMLLAYAINMALMKKYELPRLPAMYLPMGALVLWALGQLAVLGPALRAALIPPATATRSV